MSTQQPSSGDFKDIQRQRQHDAEIKNDNAVPSILERRQSGKQIDALGSISPMPTGAERMAALRDLGATFEEGHKSISKVATPTETVVPSFVDSDHLEKILHKIVL